MSSENRALHEENGHTGTETHQFHADHVLRAQSLYLISPAGMQSKVWSASWWKRLCFLEGDDEEAVEDCGRLDDDVCRRLGLMLRCFPLLGPSLTVLIVLYTETAS